MRTTINIDDELLKRAKASAAREGRTLTSVIEDSLRESLARRHSASARPPAKLPTFRGDGGVRPGVDLDDNSAVRAVLDEGAPLERRR